MGCGEAIRGVDRIAWPGRPGLNNAKPRSEGRHQDLSTPLRRRPPQRLSPIFRVAWLIVQQSSPEVTGAAGEGCGSLYRGKSEGPASLPAPASGPPSLSLPPEPGSPGTRVPGVADTELSPQVPAAGIGSDGGNDSCAPRFKAAYPLSTLLQAYRNQDDYWARESQRGQLVSIRA
jgi:hypothetical protein